MNLFEMWGSFAVRGIDEAEADIRSVSRVAEREFREMGDAGERATDAMEDGFKRAGSAWDSFKGNIGSEAVSRGFEALEQGVTMLVDTAAEAQEDFGKLSVAFDKAGYSAETASSVYYDFVGLLGETDQSVEASNHLAKLCKNEEELAMWGNIAAGVFAEFGDSLPLEGLTEAA